MENKVFPSDFVDLKGIFFCRSKQWDNGKKENDGGMGKTMKIDSA